MSRSISFKACSSAVAFLLMSAASLAVAGPKDDVAASVQKLDDAPNYSWTTTTTGGRGAGKTEGKTQKDGLTVLTVPTRDATRQVVMQGTKIAIQTDDGWQSVEELADAQGPARFMAMMVRGLRTPAAQAKMFLDSGADLTKADDGSYSGDLPEDAAKKMLSFGGRGGGGMTVNNAKGSGKFWIGDNGMLSKMEVHMTGSISFNGNDRDIDRTTTTEIKDVGSTTVDVPAEAKAKLSGGSAGGAAAPTTQPQ